MMKLRQEGRFTFAQIPQETLEKLNAIEFDRVFITQEQISQVKSILNVSDSDDIEYVRAIRNSIVKYYEQFTTMYLNDEVRDFANFEKYNTKMSAITCALDTILEF